MAQPYVITLRSCNYETIFPEPSPNSVDINAFSCLGLAPSLMPWETRKPQKAPLSSCFHLNFHFWTDIPGVSWRFLPSSSTSAMLRPTTLLPNCATYLDYFRISAVKIPNILAWLRGPSHVPEVSSTVSGPGCACQEIGLVAFMFFFELLFSYVSSSISFYVPLTNLFSIILFLIC